MLILIWKINGFYTILFEIQGGNLLWLYDVNEIYDFKAKFKINSLVKIF